VARSSAREQVYSTLREWIVRGVLEPGEKLRDVEIAESLGVSRTPVREAVRRLEDEGLVESSASRWTRVAGLDLVEAARIYPIVWSLEPLALRFAGPRLGEAEIERMESANDRLRRAADEESTMGASEADRDFHQVFIDASDNAELVRILEELKTKLFRLEVVYFGGWDLADLSISEHERILEALRAGDYAAAADAVGSNWKQSLRRLLEREDLALRDFGEGVLEGL
jgi:DNA-binding GntR family transcriptional regulator